MELTEKNLFTKCTSQDGNLQDILLEHIKNNNIQDLKGLLDEDNEIDINFTYDHPYYKTTLQIACLDPETRPECIQILLDYGADPLSWDSDEEKNCINFAAESGNPKILDTLLQHLKKKSIHFANSTAILTLIQSIQDSDEKSEENYLEVLQILLDYNIDINISDIESGQTAIHRAALYGYKKIVNTILCAKTGQVNLDKHVDARKRSARDIIIDKKLYPGDLPEYWDENDNITVETLFKNIRENDSNNFITNYNSLKDNFISSDDESRLILKAVENGLDGCVKILLENEVKINRKPEEQTLMEIASSRGYYKIIKLLIQKNPDSATISKSLIKLSKAMGTHRQTENINFPECLKILLKHKDLKINYRDPINNNTALHYAAKYQTPEMCLKILEKGASLACPDIFGIIPIADMNVDTFKMHLDKCILPSEKECANDDFDKYLTINMTSLLPPRINTEFTETEPNCKIDVEGSPLVNKPIECMQETSVLEYMCKSQEFKHLLIHPVIMTFLYLKWYHIRIFFYINLAVYISFITSLVFFIMSVYTSVTYVSYITLFITFLILLIREFGQMIIFKLRYFSVFENWLEMILLTLTALILSNHFTENTIRQFSALAIVLSATELLLLVGQFPSLSTNIMMLRTVSFTFFKLLLWYSILLLAFALSFYTLFQETNNQKDVNNKNETENSDEEEQDFFLNPGMSLLKTIVMLTGEFDAGSIKFSSYPVISHIIFVLFVFLITIVLFNLLNGLAVNDTQIIKSDAELYDQMLRVEHISHLERVLLKNKLIHHLPIVKKICLFPSNILKTEIKVYVNQNYKVIYEKNAEESGNQCYKCHNIYLGKKIQKAIKNQMQEKQDEANQKDKDDAIVNQLKALKIQLDTLEALLQNKRK